MDLGRRDHQRPDHDQQADLDRRIQSYYGGLFDEDARLTTRSTTGRLELARVRELVGSRLAAGSRVADIGGGTGVHARWLIEAGHRVALLDPVPAQVAKAATIGTEAVVGDARALPGQDATFDAALLFGPLYHLASADDRHRALQEATRVTRCGGLIAAAAIPRMVAFANNVLGTELPDRLPSALADLIIHGTFQFDQARFPAGHLHTGEELERELRAAGLTEVEVVGLEGPAGLALEVRGTTDDSLFEHALALARQVEAVPSIRDLSNHLLGIGLVAH